ncbi:MAG: VWA domain-containing protein [Bryobacteraceae bacterium]|jgi:VWFA-related protein
MNLSRRSLLSAFSLFPAAYWLRGQQPPAAQGAAPVAPASGQQPLPAQGATAPGQQPPTYSAEVKVVNILATVRDKKGQIVTNLDKDDFVVDEEGHPQVIRYFARETDLPLTLGLLVDTSGSQRNVLSDERAASQRFFDQVLRADRDLAFLIHFDKEVELLEDLTPSRAKLEKALDELQVNEPQLQRQRGGGYPPDDPSGSSRQRGGTHLYDAVLLASDELMRKQKGRKALVLLTDGVDRGSKTTLFESIAAAERADTLVYSVLFAGSNGFGNGGGYGPGMGRRRGGMGYPGGGYPGGGGGYPGGGNRADGKKVLEQMARETGGRFIEVSHHLPIDKVFAEIEEELRSQYSIGYTSDQTGDAPAYRHIHLTTKKKDLVVQARDGYYAS